MWVNGQVEIIAATAKGNLEKLLTPKRSLPISIRIQIYTIHKNVSRSAISKKIKNKTTLQKELLGLTCKEKIQEKRIK